MVQIETIMARPISEHIQDELNVVKSRLSHFYRWGYSPELNPLVEALEDCDKRLEHLLSLEKE